ncbi:hypothetical protein [Sphingomonas faeni]|uniref:hypothetical protein n=1 Tax=Sphingomonas faeni TaxID=185950 RepID=UPI0024134A76|nr:hypothetical protein [Sphingomonas faeni]
MLKYLAMLAGAAVGMAVPAIAQIQKSPETIQSTESLEEDPALTAPTRTPVDPVDQFAQRQTREGVAKETGIEPLGRISTRIQNRVESRLRNRIDRNYNPQANAISPFVVAGDQARVAGAARTKR